MNIKNAIKKYKENIVLTLNGEKDFEFIRCNASCNCIVGIKWNDMSLNSDKLIVKNGFNFKLSMSLENSLEFCYYPIIKNYDEIKTKLEREEKLKELGL
jgi:hypothetical protein